MRVRLEIESREEVQFSTLTSSLGQYRRLDIKIEGRSFATWYRLDDWRNDDKAYLEHVDEHLARQFEFMIGRVLKMAMKMMPDGLELTTATDEEIRDALALAERERVRKLEKGMDI